MYLLAVLAVGMLHGTVPAVLTSICAFLLYDFLFVEPVFTFTIASPHEWLNLLLLLAVAVVIGRLAALQTERTQEAAERALEAESLHRITGVLASTRTVGEAAPLVLARLAETTAMDRVWVGLGPSSPEERIIADTAASEPLPIPGWHVVLQPMPDGRARWARTHVGLPGTRRSAKAAVHRVRVEVAGEPLGSLWALRARGEREPDRAETRILSAAAAQLGQAVVRDRLAEEATQAEILRASEALKSALLDSVSHDLRTPLATIRAAAGSMLDRSIAWTEDDQLDAFQTIDAEAERMGRLVRNLLDLSRIEGGALKPELAAHDAGEIARQAAERIHRQGKTLVLDVPPTLPAVLVDDVYLGQVLANLLENAIRYGGPTIVVEGRAVPEEAAVELRVEDDGAGVPDGGAGAPLRQVLPGAAGRRSLPARDGHRPDGRGGACPRDGRKRSTPSAALPAAWRSWSGSEPPPPLRPTLTNPASSPRMGRDDRAGSVAPADRGRRAGPADAPPAPGSTRLPRGRGRHRWRGAAGLGCAPAGPGPA